MNAVVQHSLPGVPEAQALSTPMRMLEIAVSQNADIAKLEKLMELQRLWEANEARKAFVTAFSAFKAEAVSVIRNKTVTDGPLKGKSYAELFAVVDAVTPALSKHGLAYAWKITKDERDWIEVTCVLTHVAGHCESVSFGGPPDSGGAKNPIQARASTKSYLERYTLLAITGLSSKGQDDDGGAAGKKPPPQQADEPEGYDNWACDMEAVADEGTARLQSAWQKASDEFRRYTVKYEDAWWASLKKKAAKVAS